MSSEKVSFNSVPRTIGYSETPGTYLDVSEPTFMLQVSPKGKAVWRSRAKGLDSKEIGKICEFELSIDERGQRHTNYEVAKEQAREKLRTARMTPEELLRHKGRTLDDAFELYLKNRHTKAGKPLAETTKKGYRSDYNRYLKAKCGNWVLKDTKAGAWEDVLRDLYKITPSHAIACHALLSGIYSYLSTRDELEVNPMMKVRRQRFLAKLPRRDKRVRIGDLPHFVRNMSALRVRHSRDIATLFLYTGFRHKALLGLRWDCINYDLGYYEVLPNTEGWKGFTGQMPLSDAALELLQERYKSQVANGVKSKWVFPQRHGKRPNEHMVDAGEAVNRCAAGLGYTLSPHDMRRTFATMAHTVLGGDLKSVGALLGHRWTTDQQGEVLVEQQITANYTLPELLKLRADANRVVQFIREISGTVPLSDENRMLAERNGVEFPEIETID